MPRKDVVIIAGASGFPKSVEFPLRASGVVSITKDKLPKMAAAVKIHVHEIKSRHPCRGGATRP